MTTTSPRSAALAYRIWGFAAPREWDVTVSDIAQYLGASVRSVSTICRHKGWSGRLRRNAKAPGAVYQNAQPIRLGHADLTGDLADFEDLSGLAEAIGRA